MNSQNNQPKRNRGEEKGRSAQTPPESETNGNAAIPSTNAKPADKPQQNAKIGHNASAAKNNRTVHGGRTPGRSAASAGDEKAMRSGRARAAQDAERLARATGGAAAEAREGAVRTNVRKHRWNTVAQNQAGRSGRNPLSPQRKFENAGLETEASPGGQTPVESNEVAGTMLMPLFPLKNVVLFPGMVLPLHIFESRYREMINACIEEQRQFGVVLIEEGVEVGGEAVPHRVGTAARITKVTRQDDGRINIVAVGTQRFEVIALDHSKAYLQATVKPLPVVNGRTRRAEELVQQLLPRIFEYVDLLEQATKQKLPIDRMPEDPIALAMLVAIGMQAPPQDKQRLLEKAGIPEMLAFEAHLLSREALFLRHMVDTQHDVQQMNMGPTGNIFPN